MAKNDLQGALDLLILKTLSHLDSMHGYGITMHIRCVTDELLIVEEGSLYPALHRIEQNGLVRASWAITDYGRKAKRKMLHSGSRASGTTRGVPCASSSRTLAFIRRGRHACTGYWHQQGTIRASRRRGDR